MLLQVIDYYVPHSWKLLRQQQRKCRHNIWSAKKLVSTLATTQPAIAHTATIHSLQNKEKIPVKIWIKERQSLHTSATNRWATLTELECISDRKYPCVIMMTAEFFLAAIVAHHWKRSFNWSAGVDKFPTSWNAIQGKTATDQCMKHSFLVMNVICLSSQISGALAYNIELG